MSENIGLNLDDCFVIQDEEWIKPAIKERWDDGPWCHEPDHIEWFEDTYFCLIRRSHMGALCGYVGVDFLHPWYGNDYGELNIVVHGDLTYSNLIKSRMTEEEFWCLGFDCSHMNDYVPGMVATDKLLTGLDNKPLSPAWMFDKDTYKDIGYVVQEIRSMITQATGADDHPNIWT